MDGRVFNQFGCGGFMEWNTPEFRTFSDTGMHIFVYSAIFDDYRGSSRFIYRLMY
jgi:hypothetical protein